MKTLAEVKRSLTLGRVVTMTGLADWVVTPAAGMGLGDERTVTKVQTGGVWLSTTEAAGLGSYLDWGRSAEWTVEGDTFRHKDGRAYTLK